MLSPCAPGHDSGSSVLSAGSGRALDGTDGMRLIHCRLPEEQVGFSGWHWLRRVVGEQGDRNSGGSKGLMRTGWISQH